MPTKTNPMYAWRSVAVIALILLVVVSSMFAYRVANDKLEEAEQLSTRQDENVMAKLVANNKSGKKMLSLWSDDSTAKDELIEYVERVTDGGGNDYIPAEDRIVVFDLEGTLFLDDNPIGITQQLYYYRVMEDEEYSPLATREQKKVAESIDAVISQSEGATIDAEVFSKCYAEVFAGMTVSDYEGYVSDFLQRPALDYSQMTKAEAFYNPMIEVVDYLKANDFTVYICCDGERVATRTLAGEVLELPAGSIIGSDDLLEMRYNVENVDEVDGTDASNISSADVDFDIAFGGLPERTNVKEAKAISVFREIGRQPILVFGDSEDDLQMAEYATQDNKYETLVFMILHDDEKREISDPQTEGTITGLAAQYGWKTISVKDDWTGVFGAE